MWFQDAPEDEPYMLIDGIRFYADDLARLVFMPFKQDATRDALIRDMVSAENLFLAAIA